MSALHTPTPDHNCELTPASNGKRSLEKVCESISWGTDANADKDLRRKKKMCVWEFTWLTTNKENRSKMLSECPHGSIKVALAAASRDNKEKHICIRAAGMAMNSL